MKYSLSSRQTAEYLAKADEIRVAYRDNETIYDLIEKYPNAKINLELPLEPIDVDWKRVKEFSILAKDNFIIGVINGAQMGEAMDRQINFYHRAPLHSFQELNDLRLAGVEYVYLGAPLFFQLDKVRRYYPTLKVRAIANVALPEGSMSYNNGVCGTWIRPEDVPTYEPYIDTIEFADELSAERALFRIYAEQHKWGATINTIIKDIHHEASNRMIPPTLAEVRISCGQRCMENGHCRLCERTFDLANPDLLKSYLASQEQS